MLAATAVEAVVGFVQLFVEELADPGVAEVLAVVVGFAQISVEE